MIEAAPEPTTYSSESCSIHKWQIGNNYVPFNTELPVWRLLELKCSKTKHLLLCVYIINLAKIVM